MIGHEAMDNGQHNTVLGLIARPKAQRSNSILMKIFYKGLSVQHHKGMKCETVTFFITKLVMVHSMKVLVFLGICFTINNMYLCGKKVIFFNRIIFELKKDPSLQE